MDPTKHHALSPMQQGLFFHYLRDGRSAADVVQLVCELPEAVDAGALRAAWEAAAARHEGLRAWFEATADGAAAQGFADAIALDWVEEDWRGAAPDGQGLRLERFLEEDRRSGFDLGRPPLWRIRLIRLADAEFRCVWTLHHVMADGRSCAAVLDEVFAAYDARGARAASPGVTDRYIVATPQVVQSRVFLDWLSRREARGDEAFWKNELSGISAPTRMHGAGAADGSGHGSTELRLSRETTRALHDAAERNGVTLNTLAQAAWALVLARHAASADVVFGVIRAGRSPALPAEAHSVGVYINTVPMRIRIEPDRPFTELLREVRSRHLAMRAHEHAPLARIQQWSETGGAPLFDSILIFDHATLDASLRAQGGAWARRRVHHLERTGYPVTVYAYGEDEMLLRVAWSRQHIADATGERLLRHFARALTGMVSAHPCTVRELPVLEAEEEAALIRAGTGPAREVPRTCVHDLFLTMAADRPDDAAVSDDEGVLSFADLDRRSAALGARLQALGVQPGDRVGICLERTTRIPVALLAVLRAGCAYVPLDPAYPPARLAYMATDANLRAVIAQPSLLPAQGFDDVPCIDVDGAGGDPGSLRPVAVRSDDVAYVIYTSGSTGRPKGVMVEHRQVVNFLLAMDRHIDRGDGDVWLALTSLSFDISVLELLWTLTRGVRVVIHGDGRRAAPRPMPFSLFYFAAGGDADGADPYRLLLDGARWADTHGFEAVWTPERHFHAFGGLFPNPAVTGAAIAAVTERVQVRAGSVVLPLHHPVRVAEEWAVVDRLSGGRVGVSIASGWHPEDFVLAPDRFAARKDGLFEALDQVRRLWRGEAVTLPGPHGAVEVRTMPRPVQPELPVWLTTSGTRATFERAGAAGVHVLTHLLGQNLEDLAGNVRAYRRAREEAGHDPASGRVALMVHTFVAEDDATAREAVREPLIAYLASAVDLVKNFADQWTAVSRRAAPLELGGKDLLSRLAPEDREALLSFAFERYFETSGLLGSVSKCTRMAHAIRAAGVDEIACLIDFGVPPERVLRHLDLLDEVRKAAAGTTADAAPEPVAPAIRKHRVTHVQCTPSRARLLLAEPDAREALAGVRQMLVGGESLPGDLARRLTADVGGRVLNMYGPTETTVWSCVQEVSDDAPDGTVPIGRPVLNTRCRVVGPDGGLSPAGVPGELWIGGAGVARGYLDRAELTAERFVSDAADAGSRWYRTGDRVRWRDDGALDFLGRNDHQVKVRGHRIEIGEIEAVLAAFPGVRASAVAAQPDGAGGVRLVGYVVPVNGRSPHLDRDVRSFLGTRLPEVMVPQVVVVMDALPLTPNGKLDRGALPGPESKSREAAVSAGPPATAVEKIVAEVWREVLGLDELAVTDNFFDLGGHSLLTIQVQNRLRERLSRDVPITDIFRFPTIRTLVTHLEGDAAPVGAETGSRRAELRRQAQLRRSGPADGGRTGGGDG